MAIGTIAEAALRRSGGLARVVACVGASTYLTAGDDIVWLGGTRAPLHPRAILTELSPRLTVAEVEIDHGSLVPWQPAAPCRASAERLAGGWRGLATTLTALGAPRGFGALLVGAPLAFPLDGAREAARALAIACAGDDARAAVEAALALLGRGNGLTPSGDDYVGGALFARHLLADDGRSTRAWRRAARSLVAAAPARTHPISVTLLGDLAAGLGWAPLHALAAALAAGRPESAGEAAGALTRLGHTSGWDLLAGFGAGLGVAGNPPAI